MNTDEVPPPYADYESKGHLQVTSDNQVASDNQVSTNLEMLKKELELKKLEIEILQEKEEKNKKEKEDYQKKFMKFNNKNLINEKIKSQIKEIIIKINKCASSPNNVQLYLNLLDKNDITILDRSGERFDTYDQYRPHIIKIFGGWEECTFNTFTFEDNDIQYSVTEESQIECQYQWKYKERFTYCCCMLWCVFCPCTMMPIILPFLNRESRFTTLRFNIRDLSNASTNPRRMNYDIKEYDIKICYTEGFY